MIYDKIVFLPLCIFCYCRCLPEIMYEKIQRRQPSRTLSKFRQSTDFGGFNCHYFSDQWSNQSKDEIQKWGLKWLNLIIFFVFFHHDITYIKCLVLILFHLTIFWIMLLAKYCGTSSMVNCILYFINNVINITSRFIITFWWYLIYYGCTLQCIFWVAV